MSTDKKQEHEAAQLWGLLGDKLRESGAGFPRWAHLRKGSRKAACTAVAEFLQQDSGDDDSSTLEDGPLKDTITDMVSRLLYSDRKEDEVLPRGEIQRLVKGGWVTHEQIVRWFSDELKAAL